MVRQPGAYGEQILNEMGPHAERGLPVAGKPTPAQATKTIDSSGGAVLVSS